LVGSRPCVLADNASLCPVPDHHTEPRRKTRGCRMPLEEASPERTRIGWIGTGVMGASMCGHLIDRGYRVTVYSRTRAKAEPLLAKGAAWADSPRAVAEQSDMVFTIVGFPRDVREVILGPNGILAAARPSLIVVD